MAGPMRTPPGLRRRLPRLALARFQDETRLQLFGRRVAAPSPLLQLAVLVGLYGLKVDAPPLPAGDVEDLQRLLAPRLEPVRDPARDENPFALAEVRDERVARTVELDAAREHEPRRIDAGVGMEIGLTTPDNHLDPDVQSAAATEVQVLLAALLVLLRPDSRRLQPAKVASPSRLRSEIEGDHLKWGWVPSVKSGGSLR